jgi:hypothetical protein
MLPDHKLCHTPLNGLKSSIEIHDVARVEAQRACVLQ